MHIWTAEMEARGKSIEPLTYRETEKGEREREMNRKSKKRPIGQVAHRDVPHIIFTGDSLIIYVLLKGPSWCYLFHRWAL